MIPDLSSTPTRRRYSLRDWSAIDAALLAWPADRPVSFARLAERFPGERRNAFCRRYRALIDAGHALPPVAPAHRAALAPAGRSSVDRDALIIELFHLPGRIARKYRHRFSLPGRFLETCEGAAALALVEAAHKFPADSDPAVFAGWAANRIHWACKLEVRRFCRRPDGRAASIEALRESVNWEPTGRADTYDLTESTDVTPPTPHASTNGHAAAPAPTPSAAPPRPLIVLCHRDEHAEECRVLPTGIRWGESRPGEPATWLIEVWDCDRLAARSMPLNSVIHWRTEEQPA